MLPLALKNIREVARDRKLLMASIFFPAFLLVLSHFFFARTRAFLQQVPLAVVNPEPVYPKAGKLLVMALERMCPPGSSAPFFSVRVAGRAEAMQLLAVGKVAGVLVIPRGFTQGLDAAKKSQNLLLVLNGGDRRSQILAFQLEAFVRKFGFLVEKSKGKLAREPVTLLVVARGAEGAGPERESLVEIFLFAFLFLIPHAAGEWVGEIERGSFLRFRMARIPAFSLLAGSFGSTLCLALVQAGCLLATALLLGLKLSLLLFWIGPVAVALALASQGLGLILSGFIEKEKQSNIVASILILPLYMICGPFADVLGESRAVGYLPWHQGYAILTAALSSTSPAPYAIGKMIMAACVLALAGMGIFSAKRLRYG